MAQGSLSGSKGRIYLLIGGVIAVIVIGIFIIVANPFSGGGDNLNSGNAGLSGVGSGGSASTGASTDQTVIDAVNKQNEQNAQDALKSGGSSVATSTGAGGSFTPIISGGAPITSNQPIQPCDVANLVNQHSAGLTVAQVQCSGSKCPCQNYRKAGFPLYQFKGIFKTAQLKTCGFSLEQFIAAGYGLKELKKLGFSANDVIAAYQKSGKTLTASQLRAAGYSASELKNAGFSAAELYTAGVPYDQVKSAFANDPSSLETLNGMKLFHGSQPCPSPEKLKALVKRGVSAETAIKTYNCGLAAFKNAGYSAAELADAYKQLGTPVSAAQLLAAGFKPGQLKTAGFSAGQLRQVGLSAEQLKSAGYQSDDILNAGYSAGQLKSSGYSANDLIAHGYSPKDLQKVGYTASELSRANVSPDELIAAGYTQGELLRSGIKAGSTGCSVSALKQALANNVAAKDLKDRGCSVANLKRAGYKNSQLQAAGFTQSEISAAHNSLKNSDGSNTANNGSNNGSNNASNNGSNNGSNNSSNNASNNNSNTGGGGDSNNNSSGDNIGNNPGNDNNNNLTDEQIQQKRNQATLAKQARDNLIQERQSSMTTEAGALMAKWSNVPTHSFQQAQAVKSKANQEGATNASGQNTQQLTQGASSTGANAEGITLKAGTEMYAVLNSSIDSDDNLTPAMVTVVSGPLKGSKLIGEFSLAGTYSTHLLLKFNSLDWPSAVKTIPINAVAVDPNTSHAALEGSVDHHYWQRYGVMFLSAFASGVGEGLQASKTNMDMAVVDPSGKEVNLVKVGSKPSDKELALMGLGQVGSAFAQDLQKYINRPPTIRIASGTGVGILLTQDLQLPAVQ